MNQNYVRFYDLTSQDVYDTTNFTFLNVTLSEHEEPVQIMKKINDYSFVTASTSGNIVIWSSTNLKKISSIQLKDEDWQHTQGKNLPIRIKNIIILKVNPIHQLKQNSSLY
jgi:hypothetical protein